MSFCDIAIWYIGLICAVYIGYVIGNDFSNQMKIVAELDEKVDRLAKKMSKKIRS